MRCATWLRGAAAVVALLAVPLGPRAAATEFDVVETTIADLQRAILSKETTASEITRRYLARIKAYNGSCVAEREGLLGRIETIPNAGQINALQTLNLRPRARREWRFDDRKARSMTDASDEDPRMPDAIEVAAALDEYFAGTGELVGPLHGVVIAIKDQFDTFDMRTTSGADAFYRNDRPPDDATFVARLRAAGAIIIAKANMGEYAGGDRSSFGGTFCNPYDTERSPGRSSGGSGSAVAANLVTCAIAEESGPSARNPGKNNSAVALAPTQELVSRDGMIPASFMNDRVGPICRTVEDVARILDVIAGYDPKDELTAFGVGRLPPQAYASYATDRNLAGVRIGVLREYMDKSLFTAADEQSIELVEAALADLARAGATIVDPGPGKALFEECVARYAPSAASGLFVRQQPQLFPVDDAGNPTADHVARLVDLRLGRSRFPEGPSIRGLGEMRTVGERKYAMSLYLAERGDESIRTIDDLIAKSSFFVDVRPDSGFSDKKEGLENANEDLTFDVGSRLAMRFALQQVTLQCMALLDLDAVTYPTSNVPAAKLGAPIEPTVNGRQSNAWALLGAHGFPAITVPAGFTTRVYDRVADVRGKDGSKLVGPVPARLPVGIDFLARPFDEPTLIRIAAAYEAATHHRLPPPGFGRLTDPDESATRAQ